MPFPEPSPIHSTPRCIGPAQVSVGDLPGANQHTGRLCDTDFVIHVDESGEPARLARRSDIRPDAGPAFGQGHSGKQNRGFDDAVLVSRHA